MIFRFSIYFVILFSSIFYSQNFSINGKIFDKTTKSPLTYANIRIAGTSTGTATNREGLFEFRLPKGKYKFISSFIGYVSDTITVTVNENIDGLKIELIESIVNLKEVIVIPGVNPALAIIEKAIKRKNERNQLLNSYTLNAYTKGIIKTTEEFRAQGNSATISLGNDTSALKITGLLENQSTGFYKKPNKYKEQILARKQSSNFPSSINTLTGGRIIQNFYSDDIQFFGNDLPSPLSDNSLSYYFFYIDDTVSINNHPVYKIKMTPEREIDPGFTGDIYISAVTFDLLQVNLELNRAANTGGLLDTIKIYQQFYPFENDIYMPVDYHLIITANVLGLIKLGFEISTIMYDYKINEPIEDDFFDRAILTVFPDADKKDSTYWFSMQRIPNTSDELKAYERIDSVKNVPVTFWDRFSFLSPRIGITDNFSIFAPIAMYHYNRVEGHTIDYGFETRRLFDNRLNSNLLLNYGFADKKVKWNLNANYLLGEYRTHKITFEVYDKLNILFSESSDYNEFSTTLLALLSKDDFNDYYYSKGLSLKFTGEVLPILNLSLGFENRSDKQAIKNSDFSFFAKNRAFRPNLPIYDVSLNSLKFGFNFDFRNYIEDGLYRRRVSSSGGYFTFGGDVTVSNNSIIKTDLDFVNYEFRARSSFGSFGQTSIDLRLYAFYADGAIPIQNYYSLPGNINLTGRDNSFRTLFVNEIAADRGVAFSFLNNLKDEPFRWLGISFLKKLEIHLTHFVNVAWTSISTESKSMNNHPFYEFKKPFIETGFGVGHVLSPVRFEFSWKLTHRGFNDYRVGIATPLI
ncbi:MAG: DUF5686 family protein [Ignavibacteria bacterium]|nr:DUF5686 family protein [Ignavibacteria bacterium]